MKVKTDRSESKPAILYVRFSSKSQDPSWGGTSKDRQIKDGREYANRNGLHIVDTFVDDGISAKDGKNWERNLKLAIVAVPQGGVLLVETDSRFSRQSWIDTAYFMKHSVILARDCSVIYFATGSKYDKSNIDTLAGGAGLFIGSASANKDNTDRKNFLLKSVRERRAAMANGERKGIILPPWLKSVKNDRGRVVDYTVIEEKANIIRRIFDLYSADNGAYAIVKILNTENVPVISRRKYDRLWNPTFVQRVLKNKAVIGYFTKVTPHAKVFPPIIEESQYFDAVAKMETKGIVRGRKSNNDSIITGVCYCKCGGKLVRHTSGGHKYLLCQNAAKGACSYNAIRYELIETPIRYFLSTSLLLSKLSKNEDASKPKQSAVLLGEIASVEKQIANITKMVLEGLASRALVAEQIKLEDAVALLRTKLETQTAIEMASKASSTSESLLRLQASIKQNYHTAEGKAIIRQQVKEVFESITIDMPTKTVAIKIKNTAAPYTFVATEEYAKNCYGELGEK